MHPTDEALEAYAYGEGEILTRRNVAAHSIGCTRCRALLEEFSHLREMTVQLRTHVAPPYIIEEVIHARESALRVHLNTSSITSKSPHNKHRERSRWIAAALVIIASALAVLTVRPERARGNQPELHFSPSKPRAGDLVRAEYIPSASLSHYGTIVLRSRYRTARTEDGDRTIGQRTVAVLKRQRSGVFTGAFRLPDSVVYAVFAVEDSAAKDVDTNSSRLWDLMIHDERGEPTFSALYQRRADLHDRNWVAAANVSREMTKLFPSRPASWDALLFYESQIPGDAPIKEIESKHSARFDTLNAMYSVVPKMEAIDEVFMHLYARDTHSKQQSYWLKRLLVDQPKEPNVNHWATWNILWTSGKDTSGILRRLDSLYRANGPLHRDPAMRAFQYVRNSTPDVQLLWLERTQQSDRVFGWSYLDDAVSLMAGPLVLDYASNRLRTLIREESPTYMRPLESTHAQFKQSEDARRAKLLAILGRALIKKGQLASAADTLRIAASLTWDIGLFRDVAKALSDINDTSAARGAWANIAVDPGTPDGIRESIRAGVGSFYGTPEWHQLLNLAEARLLRRTMSESVLKRLPDKIRVHAHGGSDINLRTRMRGRPTFIAVWDRACGPSYASLPDLQRIAMRLKQAGYNVITITPERPSPALTAFINDHKLQMPIYYDIYGDVKKALAQYATPDYFVVDESGRLRFEHTKLQDAPREMRAVAGRQSTAAPADD